MESTYGHGASEQELLAAVAVGDLQAFEYLYRSYEKRVYQYVSTFLHDQAFAEEVVVEVMVAVRRGACTFTNTSRVSTWIFGIARHKAIDALRR